MTLLELNEDIKTKLNNHILTLLYRNKFYNPQPIVKSIICTTSYIKPKKIYIITENSEDILHFTYSYKHAKKFVDNKVREFIILNNKEKIYKHEVFLYNYSIELSTFKNYFFTPYENIVYRLSVRTICK